MCCPISAHLLSVSRTHCLYFIHEFCLGVFPGPRVGKILFCFDLVLMLLQNLSQTQDQNPNSLAPGPRPFPMDLPFHHPFPTSAPMIPSCYGHTLVLVIFSSSIKTQLKYPLLFPGSQNKELVPLFVCTLNTWYVLLCQHSV